MMNFVFEACANCPQSECSAALSFLVAYVHKNEARQTSMLKKSRILGALLAVLNSSAAALDFRVLDDLCVIVHSGEQWSYRCIHRAGLLCEAQLRVGEVGFLWRATVQRNRCSVSRGYSIDTEGIERAGSVLRVTVQSAKEQPLHIMLLLLTCSALSHVHINEHLTHFLVEPPTIRC